MSPRLGLTRDRVIDAAIEIADEQGAATPTLAQVAARLGVRAPSLYNHVAGLDDLRHALTLRALDELGRRLQAAAVGRSGADALRAMAGAYRAFAAQRPGLAAATVPTTEVDDPEIRRAGAEILATLLAGLSAFGLRDDEAIHAARALRSAIYGFVTIERAGGFGLPEDVDHSFRWMIDRLIAALEAGGGRAAAGGR